MQQHWPLTSCRSGGQTGVDEAGVVAAHALGIPSLALLPKGFIQRGTDKIDRPHTAEQIRAKIEHGAALLPKLPASSEPQAKERPRFGSVRVVSKRKGGVQAAPGETVIDGDRNDPVFGNRHILKNHLDDDERARVIHQHLVEDFEPDVIAGGPIYRKMISLAERVAAGERLAISCWCAPAPCHCDNYASGISKLARGEDLQAEVKECVESRRLAAPSDPVPDFEPQFQWDF